MREHKQALPDGWTVDRYRVLGVLGVGGFGVTYLAEHQSLGEQVAIKEYMPNEFAVRDGTQVYPKSAAENSNFAWGLSRFLEEARTLTRFSHPNLVRVLDFFEDNSTAYMVMRYEDGEPLNQILANRPTLTEMQLKRVILPIVDGMKQVHRAGFLHRDIKPANIFVRRRDETPVLLDFGAARHALGNRTKSVTAIATAGYSPPEQYEGEGNLGTWSDIYALAAVCFRGVTGEDPVEAPRRQGRLLHGDPDPLPPLALSSASERYSMPFLEAVDAGLHVIETERPQSLDDWLAVMDGAHQGLEIKQSRSHKREETKRSGRGKDQSSSPAAARSRLSDAESQESTLSHERQPWLRTLVAAGSGIAAVTLVAAIWVFWPPDRSSERPVSTSDETSVVPSNSDSKVSRRNGDTELRETASNDSLSNAVVIDGNAILVVETEPPGAKVLVGGASVGTTPMMIENAQAGTHRVTLRLNHYRTVEFPELHFVDGEVLRINQALEPLIGRLTVLTTPVNAWIEINGERVPQRTPATLEDLPVGPIQLTLGAEDHHSMIVEATVLEHQVVSIERSLVPLPYGSLTLLVDPADATIILPDIRPAYRPGMKLEDGSYRIVVSQPGFVTVKRTFTVEGDTEVRISLEDASFTDALLSGGRGPEMVMVPSGKFRMGCLSGDQTCWDAERPDHDVDIQSPFAISTREVTFAHWDQCVESGGCNGYRPEDQGWGRGNRPVVNVSWIDARSYLQWLSREAGKSYRLPTEAEWEYAARAGTSTKYWWGNDVGTNLSNCDGCGSRWDGEVTAPVGSFTENAFGLHDMHGNVWEWMGDCWNESYNGAPSDGRARMSGDCSRRVLRGGAWNNVPTVIRATVRAADVTHQRANSGGFRVVRNADR